MTTLVAGALLSKIKPVKKLLKGVTKVFKRLFKNKIFKAIALFAAVAYLGGKGLGKWGGDAATAGSTAAAEGATTAAEGISTAAADVATDAAMVAIDPVSKATVANSGGSILKRAMSGVGKGVKKISGWAEKNPMAASMTFNALSSAFTPDEIDMLREQEEMRRARWQNMEIPDYVGMRGSGQQLNYRDGRPVYPSQPILRRAMS